MSCGALCWLDRQTPITQNNNNNNYKKTIIFTHTRRKICVSKKTISTPTHLARKSQQLSEAPGGIDGGVLQVATWNMVARLFENSDQGGLPVAVYKHSMVQHNMLVEWGVRC